MMRRVLIPACSLLVTTAFAADQPTASASVAAVDAATRTDSPQAQPAEKPAKAEVEPKALSGMSILGNQEAPKALVIVPWKSSQLGDSLGIAKALDDGRQPVDKEVFMRQLGYYEIRAHSK